MATPAEWAVIHQGMQIREIGAQQRDRETQEDCVQALHALSAYFADEDESPYSIPSRLSELLAEIAYNVSRIRTGGFSFIDPPMPLTDKVIVEWFGEEPPRGQYRF